MKIDSDQISSYLKEILHIDDWVNLFSSEPLQLLKLIVIRQVTHVYFHNLHIAATPMDERNVPSVEELVDINLQGKGGNCLHINYFMKVLLSSIGYKVYTIAGTIGFTQKNHVMNIIGLSNNEEYLVDVACGCPISSPIPLHALPFNYLCCGGSINEFRQIGKNEYAKFQIGGGFFRSKLANGENEKILISFDLTPVEYESFLPSMKLIWTDEENSPFCRNLFLFRQFFCYNGNREFIVSEENEDENSTEMELQFILVFGKNILFGSGTNRDVKVFLSYEEMIPVVLKYFPKLDVSMLTKSIEYLNTLTPIAVRI